MLTFELGRKIPLLIRSKRTRKSTSEIKYNCVGVQSCWGHILELELEWGWRREKHRRRRSRIRSTVTTGACLPYGGWWSAPHYLWFVYICSLTYVGLWTWERLWTERRRPYELRMALELLLALTTRLVCPVDSLWTNSHRALPTTTTHGSNEYYTTWTTKTRGTCRTGHSPAVLVCRLCLFCLRNFVLSSLGALLYESGKWINSMPCALSRDERYHKAPENIRGRGGRRGVMLGTAV